MRESKIEGLYTNCDTDTPLFVYFKEARPTYVKNLRKIGKKLVDHFSIASIVPLKSKNK
jgi:hypothetical protein